MPPDAKPVKAEWPINSLLGQLQPEPGWTIRRAVIASYSADLRVVAAVMLALCGASQDPELANRIRFAQALRRLKGKVAFVVQRGRIHRPHNLNRIAALLDRFVFEADCDEGAPTGGRSWHPKFVVSQWLNEETKETSWRLWLGSRNLTRDLSQDVGLLLTPGDYALTPESTADLSRSVAELQRCLPPGVAPPFAAKEMKSLASAKWRLPPGIKEIALHWIAGEDRFPVVGSRVDEAIVISPFIDKNALQETQHWTKAGVKPVVVAPTTELSRECPAGSPLLETAKLHVMAPSFDEGSSYDEGEPGTDEGETDGGADRETDRSDEAGAIHAKLIYLRRGKTKRLWLGSPNFTRRGWKRNYELAACLTALPSADPWRGELNEIVSRMELYKPPPPLPSQMEIVADRLESARKQLAASLKPIQRRDGNLVAIEAETPFVPPEDAMKLVVGLPWEGSVPQLWPSGYRSVALGDVPLEACGDLVLFELSLEKTSSSWLMRAPFTPALDEARDRASLFSYLGPDGYLGLLNAAVNAGTLVIAPPWDDPGTGTALHGTRAQARSSGPSLESLLKLYVRSPEQFDEFARIVEHYRAEESRWTERSPPEQQAAVEQLQDFNRLWDEVGSRLVAKDKRHGT